MRRSITAVAVAVVLLAPCTTAFALDYRVRRGDTLTEIAQRYGVTVDAIRRANGLTGDLIVIGQVLDIPVDRPTAGPPPERAVTSTHTVRPGESLARIASRFGVTVELIRQANGLRGSLIHPGDELRIPPRSAVVQPTTRLSARPTTRTATDAEVEILARIVKGEAHPRSSREGQVAIAAVVLNRVQDRRFPGTLQRVAHQPRQFSCYNPDVRNRLYWGRIPQWAWDAARAALAGEDPTDGATHYFNPHLVRPRWARQLVFIKRIDRGRTRAHDFYRFADAARGPVADRGRAATPGLNGRLQAD